MTLLFILISCCIIAAALSVSYGIANTERHKAKQDIINMAEGSGEPISLHDIELSKPFSVRVIDPALKNINHMLASITPREIEADVRRRIRHSGVRISVASFISIQVILAIVLPGILSLVGVMEAFNIIIATIVILLSIVIGYFLPILWIGSVAAKRDRRIQRALPDALDILTVSVEAGLGFDIALSKVVEKTGGPLADEFSVVLHEIRMGRGRADALKRLTDRSKVEDLSYFVSSLIQADRLGVSIVKMLRIQSDQMRIKRRQMAEQIARKAPLKMSVVLILFVLPALLLILLGPSFISMMETLGGR